MLPITILLTPIPVSAATCEEGFAPVVEGDSPLTLRGTGTARYLLFRVYDAALYTPAQSTPGIPEANVSACLEICYHRPLEKNVIVTAANKALAQQYSGVELAAMGPRIEELHDAYQSVSAGDRYRLCRTPDRVTLALNGETKATIEDATIARHYLNIWLGEKPLSDALRDELLASRKPETRESGANPTNR